MIIKEVEIFKDIDPKALDEIVKISMEETYSKDTVLFNKGDSAQALYVLLEGNVHLVVGSEKKVTFELSDTGEVFGWSSLVTSGIYTASAFCATDVKTLKIDNATLDEVLNRYPEAGVQVLKRLGSVISKRLVSAYNGLSKH